MVQITSKTKGWTVSKGGRRRKNYGYSVFVMAAGDQECDRRRI